MNAEQFSASGASGASGGSGSIVAWVLFNGTGTLSITASSSNVTSITDNGLGDYTINFNALSSANYAVFGTASHYSGEYAPSLSVLSVSSGGAATLKTTTACRVRVSHATNVFDSTNVSVIFVL